MNFRENMSELRVLVNDYYQNRISFPEYRKQRSKLLCLIDEDLNGIKPTVSENDDEIQIKGSIMNKALSFLTNR